MVTTLALRSLLCPGVRLRHPPSWAAVEGKFDVFNPPFSCVLDCELSWYFCLLIFFPPYPTLHVGSWRVKRKSKGDQSPSLIVGVSPPRVSAPDTARSGFFGCAPVVQHRTGSDVAYSTTTHRCWVHVSTCAQLLHAHQHVHGKLLRVQVCCCYKVCSVINMQRQLARAHLCTNNCRVGKMHNVRASVCVR